MDKSWEGKIFTGKICGYGFGGELATHTIDGAKVYVRGYSNILKPSKGQHIECKVFAAESNHGKADIINPERYIPSISVNNPEISFGTITGFSKVDNDPVMFKGNMPIFYKEAVSNMTPGDIACYELQKNDGIAFKFAYPKNIFADNSINAPNIVSALVEEIHFSCHKGSYINQSTQKTYEKISDKINKSCNNREYDNLSAQVEELYCMLKTPDRKFEGGRRYFSILTDVGALKSILQNRNYIPE